MSKKTFVEDMLSLGTGMLSNLAEARHEIKAQAKQRVGSVAKSMELVGRDEFDAAFAMVAKARNIQEELLERLAKIEAHLGLSRSKTVVKIKKRNLPPVKTKRMAPGKKRRA